MKTPFCGSAEHDVSRRAFLGTMLTGTAALLGQSSAVHCFAEPALTKALQAQNKRVILLWLAGGASQLETWDPKPRTSTGGPFAAIPTSIPGVHISELMPQMAERLKHLCLIRSLNTKNADHGAAAELMMRGRIDEASLRYPDMGAILAREMSKLTPSFLGAHYAPMKIAENMTPANLHRAGSITEEDHFARAQLQEM